MRLTGWLLAALGVAGLVLLVWREGQGGPPRFLFAMPGKPEEAAYCLAVSERIREITRGAGPAGMERHLDEQIAFWRARAGSALGAGRAALARDSGRPGGERTGASASGGAGLRAAGDQLLRLPLPLA